MCNLKLLLSNKNQPNTLISRFSKYKFNISDKLKNNVGVLFFNIMLLMPLLCFAQQHFSVDSYIVGATGYEGHCNAFIGSHRFVGAALYYLWYNLVNDPIENPFLDTVLFVLIVATSVTFLSTHIYNLLNKKSRLTFVIIDISVLISVTNVWFTELLTFSECIFITACGVAFCFGSIVAYSSSIKSTVFKLFLSAVLFICAVGVYQQFLSVFIIYSVLIRVIKIQNSDKKQSDIIKQFLLMMLFVFISATIYFIMSKGVQGYFGVIPNARTSINIDQFIDNIKYYVTHQRSILGGKNFFQTPILRRCYLVLFILWIISVLYYVKRKKLSFKVFSLFFLFLCTYCSVFIIGLISVPDGTRVIFALFSIFALLSVSSVVFANKKIISIAISLLLIFVFSLNIYKTLEMSTDLSAINAKEIAMSKEYFNQIRKYEKNNNIIVKNIVFCIDEKSDYISSVNALTLDWGIDGLMQYVNGRQFNVTKMHESIYEKYFQGKDWKYYEPEEQLIFSNDTLYLCVY